MLRLCEDQQKECEMTKYRRFPTLTGVIHAILDSHDEDRHGIVIIPLEQGNGNVPGS